MIKAIWVVCALLLGAMTLCVASDQRKVSSLVVGWNDEFNGLNWKSFPKPHAPDTALRHKGFLKLHLGAGTTVDPAPPFYYGSVSRVVDVDIDRYPILAVRAVNLRGPSWWDVIVQGYTERNGSAKGNALESLPSGSVVTPSEGEEHLVGKEIKTPSLDHDGVILFDLQAQMKNGLEPSHKIRIRLNIAGKQKGGSVEYDWIRFVRRQDAETLRVNPRIRDLIVEP